MSVFVNVQIEKIHIGKSFSVKNRCVVYILLVSSLPLKIIIHAL